MTDGDTTAIQGVKPGDVLANSGFDKLQSGARIKRSDKPVPAASGSDAP